MGNCFSSNTASSGQPIVPNSNMKHAMSSSRVYATGGLTHQDTKVTESANNMLARSARNMINLSDFRGIKKSDNIDNFYDIDKVIGRGK